MRVLVTGALGFIGRQIVARLLVDGHEEVAAVRRYDRTEATQRLRLTFAYVEPAWVVIYARDVAEPEVAQAAVRESEARYRSLVAPLPDAVILRGADGRVLACNEVAVRLFGASSEAEILGRREFLPVAWRVERESGEGVPFGEFP